MASANHLAVLKSIQTSNARLASVVNLEQPIIEIKVDERTIVLPKTYQKFLAIQNDHVADSVYFCIDRYFDGVDLATKTCVVEYLNGATPQEFRIAPILDVDITTDPNKVYFAWKLTRGATKAAGKISFAVRFYEIDPNTGDFIYNLSTSPCQATILKGLGNSVIEDNPNDDWALDDRLSILDAIKRLEQKAVCWADLT